MTTTNANANTNATTSLAAAIDHVLVSDTTPSKAAWKLFDDAKDRNALSAWEQSAWEAICIDCTEATVSRANDLLCLTLRAADALEAIDADSYAEARAEVRVLADWLEAIEWLEDKGDDITDSATVCASLLC